MDQETISPSSLITSIHSALIRMEDAAGPFVSSKPRDVDELKIGLRNLKALLLLSRATAYTGGHGCLNALLQCLMQSSSSTFADLLPRIESVLDLLIDAEEIDAHSMAEKLHLLGDELDEELSWSWVRSCLNGICRSSSLLTVDEVVGITGSSVENAPGFLSLITGIKVKKQTDAFEAIDAFEVHVIFMKSVVAFAGQVGVELENVLMPHIQPIVINAARVFIVSDADKFMGRYEQRCSEIGSRCLKVNRMAADPRVCQAYSHVLCVAKKLYSTALNMGDQVLTNLLESLISLLWDALRHASNSTTKDEFKLLYERLRFLRAVLKHEATSLDEAISGQVLVLICDAGVVICSFHQPDLGRLSDLLQRFDVFRAQVTMMSRANDESGIDDFTGVNISDEYEKAPLVLGFRGDEVNTVLDRLIGGSKYLRIVPVCGMAGLGKTTFALKLFNHPSVLHHFWTHAWCPVSQELDKKKVFLQLLNQIQLGDYSDMTDDDLANKLRQSLKGRRYLILLDDVWSREALDSLKASFPDDFTGSRIILTSRRVNIVPHDLPDERPHLLRLREEYECIEILQTKLFKKDGWSNDVGMEVAKICKGLPLTLVLISGLLATTEQQGWKEILDHSSSSHSVPGAEQCNIALDLGYKHLPDYLKPCFLYFGAFPEDREVSVRTLIRLWMAEGFVIDNKLKRIEDVGREYIEKLVERSLVMVGETRSLGGVKTCRIHDLLHQFCQSKAKQQDLLHLLLPMHDQLLDINIEPCKLQRLSVHSVSGDFKRLRLFYPGALSLLFFLRILRRDSYLFDMSFIIQIFQLLKVLHLEIVLINGIPNEVGLLTRLTYLSICTYSPIIPSSIGNLSNLETFNARILQFGYYDFPLALWNLKKLKFLYIRSYDYGLHLPVKNLENSSSLLELEACCGVIFRCDGSMEKQMQKFPHIRRLKCTIIGSLKGNSSVRFEALPQLQSLSLLVKSELSSIVENFEARFVRCEFSSISENLRRLKLDGFKLSREEIAMIGKFPNLEVLKLCGVHFLDHALEMEGEEFQKLRFLKLDFCPGLERWTASDDELSSLQKLEFRYCRDLEEIPSWLATSSTLEDIQLYGCSSTLEGLVRAIEEVQKEYGNLIKLRIVPWK